MANLTLTLDTLVDRAFFDLNSPGEEGKAVVMGSTALTAVDDTSLTLTDASGVNVSDIIEFSDELVLITAKSADATPVFTVSRGYFKTTAETHADGDPGLVNPSFPRRKIAEGVRRAMARLEALGVPLITNVTKSRVTDYSYCELPAECREVLQVLYWGTDGRLWDLPGWEFYDNVPTAKFTTGKMLNLPRYVANADELEVIYRQPYRWSTHPSDPVGASTIEVPEGAEDLPSLYAAAWCLSSREISRSEIDRSEEWSRTSQIERGVTGSMLRAKWQEFYRALDEARRLNKVPQPIIYNSRLRL